MENTPAKIFMAELIAENKRFREALEKIANCDANLLSTSIRWAINVACTALSEVE